MKKNPLHQADSLLGRFNRLDIDTAYAIAYALGHHETEILLVDRNVVTTIRQIYTGTAPGVPASSFKVRFQGGPLGRGTWHTGTLRSFILDCIAVKIQMEGFDGVRKLLNVKQILCGCPRF